ncbi:hypothetical protein FJ365_02740 [Candidatus Dependentiae bacterium]|nr:hypothetical protein [Candidatus Dependentiae bacterium]
MKRQRNYARWRTAFLLFLAWFYLPLQGASLLSSGDVAAITANVNAQFDNLPKHGFAEITNIRNSTTYPANLVCDMSLYPNHDRLPDSTIAAFKHKATGKYLAARKITIGGKSRFILTPDAADSSDPATQFQVCHHVSTIPTLRDYIGFTATVANDATMQATADGVINFPNTNFNDEIAHRNAQWTLQGATLDDAWFDNRPQEGNPGGVATYVSETRNMHVGDNVKINVETATWGLVSDDVIAATNGDSSVMRYGDIVRIGTQQGDFVTQFRNTIGRSNRVNRGLWKSYCWRVTSFQGKKKEGDSVLLGDSVLFTSLSDPSVKFVNRVCNGRTTNNNGGNNTVGVPVKYSSSARDYAMHNQPEAGMFRDTGWLQTYKSDYNGMSWSFKHKGPDANDSARLRFEFMPTAVNKDADGYSVMTRDAANGKWALLPSDKKFKMIAVRSDDDVWGIAPDNTVWQWNGKDWDLIPSTVPFAEVAVNAAKNVYAVDLQGFLYQRTPNGWSKTGGVTRSVKLRNEDYKRIDPSAGDPYASSNVGAGLPPTGDYFFYVKAVAQKNICIKIAAYDLRLFTGDGARSEIIRNGTSVAASDCLMPDSTRPVDIAVAMIGSTKTITVYANGKRLMRYQDPSFTLNPNTATLGAIEVPWQYGPMYNEPAPAGVDVDAYIATRNEVSSVAVASKSSIWCIGNEGILNNYNGGASTTPQTEIGKPVTAVSCADDGTTWAVRANSEVWALNTTASPARWEMRDPPAEKPFITSITVRNASEVYVLGADGFSYLWNGKTWAKQTNMPMLRRLSLGNGVTKIVTPIMEKMQISQMMTHDSAGNVYEKPTDASKISVEIVKLGFGGNIAPQQTVACMLPAQQNPEVSGFAETVVNIDPGATLTVQPLASRGGAWPQKTFRVKNNGTVSFLAQPTPKGDIQVILGDKISDSYLYKIKIGTAQNTRACIIKRSIGSDGKGVDEEVFGVDASQNKLAYASPGNFTPYWVSYDNGLILVGMGLPGDHVFMAYRTDDPPDLVDHAGFSTKDGIVQYSNIQYSDPVVVQSINRIDTTFPGPVSLSASGAAAAAPSADATAKPADAAAKPAADKKDATDDSPPPINLPATINLKGGSISWQKLPFRVPGGATVGFSMQGGQQCGLVLGEAAAQSKTHYIVTFGEGNNEGISVKRSVPGKPYRVISFQPNKDFAGLNLDPTRPVKAWVSYNNGAFVIGAGEIGENPVFACSDMFGSSNIQEVGFVALGNSACTVSDISLAAPLELGTEQISGAYEANVARFMPHVSGNINIVLPFWYRMSQEGPSLKLYDKITNQSFFVAGMPQQGTLYSFLATIGPDGFMSMATAAEPNNPLQKAISRQIVTLQANAQLEQQKAALIAQKGQLDSTSAQDKVQILNAKAAAMTAEAQNVSGSISGLAGGLSMAGPGGAVIALGIGLSGIATTTTMFKMASNMQVEAAKLGVSANEISTAAQREALNNQANAAKMQQEASLLQGNASFAFKSVNSYVFTDVPSRPPLGDASLTPELIEARNAVTGMMAQLNLLNVREAYEPLLSGLQEIVYRTTNCFVITPVVKKQFIDKMKDLVQAYPQVYGEQLDARVMNKLISLLMTSINNCYLISPFEDASTRDSMYSWANKQAQALIAAQGGIDLCPCYGEYIWLPYRVDSSSADNLTISFQAGGKNDLFIAFAKEPARVRNTTAPLYELKINNTKTTVSLQSLGQSVPLLSKEDYKNGSIMSDLEPRTYTITLNGSADGPTISLKIGDSKTFTWTDKYPYKGMRWIGISCWADPISITNLPATIANASLGGASAGGKPGGAAPSVASDAGDASIEGEEAMPEEEALDEALLDDAAAIDGDDAEMAFTDDELAALEGQDAPVPFPSSQKVSGAKKASVSASVVKKKAPGAKKKRKRLNKRQRQRRLRLLQKKKQQQAAKAAKAAKAAGTP